MANDKKTRRQWLYDNESELLTTAEGEFDLAAVTEQGNLFLKIYGAKQFLVDKIAGKGGEEYSDTERMELMMIKYDRLINEKCSVVHTESGFYLKDPNAVTTRTGGIKKSALYDALIADGKTHEEALAFTTKLTQR